MEGRGPLDAFRRSSELVEDRWWRTAGTLVLGWGLLNVAFFPVGLVLQVFTLSLTALFGTLLYFSLRARKESPFDSASAVTYLPPVSPTPAARTPADL